MKGKVAHSASPFVFFYDFVVVQLDVVIDVSDYVLHIICFAIVVILVVIVLLTILCS